MPLTKNHKHLSAYALAMSFNQDQVPKRVRFADNPEVHTYTPDTSPGSASSSELRTPSDNGYASPPPSEPTVPRSNG